MHDFLGLAEMPDRAASMLAGKVTSLVGGSWFFLLAQGEATGGNAPVGGPTNPITWLFYMGGAAFIVNQSSEFVFKVKSAWRRADAGTAHEKHEICERLRAAQEERIKGLEGSVANLRDQLNTELLLIREKDAQLVALSAQAREKDERINAMMAGITSNQKVLVQHVVDQARKPADPIPVTIDGASSPVPVREVGHDVGHDVREAGRDSVGHD